MIKNISVSIVLFRNPLGQIQKVLNSVYQSQMHADVFLIDNSEDHKYFKDLKIRVDCDHYQLLPKNIGFGAAHNQAIKQSVEAGYKYHLILNPDVYFEANVLDEIFKYMENHQDVGLLAPKVIYPDGQLQYLCKRLPRPYDLFIRRFGTKELKEKNNYYFEMRDKNYDEIMEVPSLSGCFMFFRSSVLQKLNGFDERFFMYLEDVDLCRRSSKVAKNIHFPRVTIVHEHGQGSYRSKKLLGYHIKSTFLYFLKWGLKTADGP